MQDVWEREFYAREFDVVSGSQKSDTEPSLLRGLTEQQQVQLTEILDDYLVQLEQGGAPNRQDLLAKYPEIASQLSAALMLYLDKLEDLYRLADNGRPLGGDLRGKQLGDYRLDKEIGRGGMGLVFSAFDQALNRQVAIKLLPMAAMLEPKFIERFRGEARAAASLEHPNIVPVYSIGEDAGIHYYAMRLIDGESLDQRIARHCEDGTQPPTNSALLQFADIADALHDAHEYGIVHRDIKPSNLLLDRSGKLWVADFGLARFQTDHRLTGTGEMVGTMRYMSPEQALGRGELVDHRTDVYSLAVTLYELLTGQSVVAGEEGPALLRTITSQSPKRLRRLRPDLTWDIQTVLEKAMARHRDDRYATAGEFAADLRRVARGEPITTKLVSPLVLTGRWMAAHSLFVSVMIVCLAIVGLGVSTGTYMVNKLLLDARDRAYENLRMAHELEQQRDATIDELALVPGVERVRQKLIESHLQYYKNFAEQSQNDPLMRSDLAKAYQRMGTLSEEKGQVNEAIAYYERAESLFDALSRPNELDTENWLRRSENLNHLALALSASGRNAEALRILEDPIRNWRTEYANGPLPKDVLLEYGLTENNYGLLLQKEADRLDDSRHAFETAIRLLSELQANDPRNQKVARGVGVAFHNLGALYAAEESLSNVVALQLLNEALKRQNALASESENRLRASIDLLATLISLGNLYLEQDTRKAVEVLAGAVEIGKRLVEISPQVDSYRRDLAISLSNLGMAYYRSGEYELAKASFKDAVHQYRGLLAEYPQHSGLQSSLGITLNNQGILLQHLGEPQAAEEAYTRAAQLLESARPAQTQALANVYANHLRMLRSAGRNLQASELENRLLALKSTSPEEKDADLESPTRIQ